MSEKKGGTGQETDAVVAGDLDAFVLLPVLDSPGEFYAVFADGSYVKGWIPPGSLPTWTSWVWPIH